LFYDSLQVRKENLEQVYVPQELRKTILQLYHDSEYAGHQGIKKTYDLITRYYYWPHIRKDISAYVKACNICITQKDTTHAKYGRTVRIPLAKLPWQEVEIDFITNLPLKSSNRVDDGSNNPTEITNTTSGGCVMVCSDKLTKMIHLVGFKHLPTARETARAYLRNLFKLHGFPLGITTDRGTQFTSQLWKKLMEFFNVEIHLATTDHHETVGQVERNNAYVETYLRCFVKQFEDEEWMDYLYLAEFCYNNSVHAMTQQAPFTTLYNYQVHCDPRTAELVHSLGSSKIIDSFAHNLANLKHILEINRTRFMDKVDERRIDNLPEIRLLDLVWLKKPSNYHPLPFYKLTTRKYGPYKVIGVDKNKNNYRLDLSNSPFPNMYPVFHISELEPYHTSPTSLETPPSGPDKIIKIIGSRKHNDEYQYLVTKNNYHQDWVPADVIDKNGYYQPLLKEYQDYSYQQFLATVSNNN